MIGSPELKVEQFRSASTTWSMAEKTKKGSDDPDKKGKKNLNPHFLWFVYQAVSCKKGKC